MKTNDRLCQFCCADDWRLVYKQANYNKKKYFLDQQNKERNKNKETMSAQIILSVVNCVEKTIYFNY